MQDVNTVRSAHTVAQGAIPVYKCNTSSSVCHAISAADADRQAEGCLGVDNRLCLLCVLSCIPQYTHLVLHTGT